MISLPTLADVVTDPAKADALPGPVLLDLLTQLVGVQHRLTLRALASGLRPDAPPEPDTVLSVQEAAELARVSPRTMLRWLRTPRYSAAVVLRSQGHWVRVSAQRLREILEHGGARPRRKVG